MEKLSRTNPVLVYLHHALESWRVGGDWWLGVRQSRFYQRREKLIKALHRSRDCLVLVATAPKVDQIAVFVCSIIPALFIEFFKDCLKSL